MTQPAPQQELTPAQMAALLALVQTQAANRQQMMAAAARGALAVLKGFNAWWNTDAINEMISDVLRVVQPLQKQAVRFTDAYLTNAASIISGTRQRPAGVMDVRLLRKAMTEQLADEILSGARRTAWVELGNPAEGPGGSINLDTGYGLEHDREYQAPEEAYGKIADNYRFNTTVRGDEPLRAQQKAEARIATVASTDVTLAVREQYRRNMNAQGATGFRRILHPELSKTGPCGLCVVAADRVYKSEDLLPLHNKCVCEVLPVYGKVDPGITLNGDDLRRIYEAAGGVDEDGQPTSDNTREGLRRVRVVLTEHGELGPILVHGEQSYRGPEEVARNYASNRRVRERAILDALYPIHDQALQRAEQGDKLPKSLHWQRKRIEELEASLGR